VAHIITAVIGSGVLSLAWSISQLGWIGGPVALLSCAIATYISSSLLADCYRHPDSVTGKRNHSFMDAVRVNLGNYNTFINSSLCRKHRYIMIFMNSTIIVITSNCFSGNKRTYVAGFLQFLSLYVTNVAYVLTTATSMRYFSC